MVIDALDECERDSAADFLSLFMKLLSEVEGFCLKVFLTSRVETHIEEALGLERVLQLRIMPATNKGDLEA